MKFKYKVVFNLDCSTVHPDLQSPSVKFKEENQVRVIELDPKYEKYGGLKNAINEMLSVGQAPMYSSALGISSEIKGMDIISVKRRWFGFWWKIDLK